VPHAEVKLCDIDHVLMPKRINGRKPVVNRAHIRIVNEGVFEYTDHYGKRTTLDIDWNRIMDDGQVRSSVAAAQQLQDRGVVTMMASPRSLDDNEEAEVEGPGKEKIRDDVLASYTSSSSSSSVAPASQVIVIPIE
jgi:hypothetical protein